MGSQENTPDSPRKGPSPRKSRPLIRCGDHKLAPGVVVCQHILAGMAGAIVPVPAEGGGEVENDWFCTKCYERFFGDEADSEPDPDNVHLVCMHCLRDVLKPYRKARVKRDPNSAGPPRFMFNRDGRYILYDDGEERGIVLSRTRKMARQYVSHVEKKLGIKLVIAEIAAITDIPLSEFLDQTIEKEGANCAFVISAIDSDKVTCDRLLPPGGPST